MDTYADRVFNSNDGHPPSKIGTTMNNVTWLGLKTAITIKVVGRKSMKAHVEYQRGAAWKCAKHLLYHF